MDCLTPWNWRHDAESDDEYGNAAAKIASETPHCFYVDQYNNPLNPEAYYMTTGREIWDDLGQVCDQFEVH